jgi:DNA (cytosine-5)-methyltransferase 1
MTNSLTSRLERIARGEPPRVVDLFAGAGGLSLGFQRAGFRIESAVEFDPIAARTHALNFHPDDIEAHGVARDIVTTEPNELGLDGVDVLVGGPPCQAYARVGRAKLREVADHPAAFKVDPRGNLYLRYLAWVRALRPLALLVENVPDILHYGHHNVMQEMTEALDDLGYDARYSLLNSVYFGCPQMRDRVYLIAYLRELREPVRFPRPTRFMRLPRGYAGTRAVALRHVDLFGGSGYVDSDPTDQSLPGPVTAREAIADLPPIMGNSVTRGPRRFCRLTRYRTDADFSNYVSIMRRWPGFAADEGVFDHVIRALPRDVPIFRAMRRGAEYPEAFETARVLAAREAARLALTPGTEAHQALFARMVPPYDVGKFPNRWWKMEPDQPVRTLMAHIGKDSYSHIHWDSAQARTISVREAARLQGFPDGFVFAGTMNPAFRQIGNAVAPLMAAAIGEVMLETLRTAARAQISASLEQNGPTEPGLMALKGFERFLAGQTPV